MRKLALLFALAFLTILGTKVTENWGNPAMLQIAIAIAIVVAIVVFVFSEGKNQ